jgi:hypothetical protein
MMGWYLAPRGEVTLDGTLRKADLSQARLFQVVALQGSVGGERAPTEADDLGCHYKRALARA